MSAICKEAARDLYRFVKLVAWNFTFKLTRRGILSPTIVLSIKTGSGLCVTYRLPNFHWLSKCVKHITPESYGSNITDNWDISLRFCHIWFNGIGFDDLREFADNKVSAADWLAQE